MFNAPFLMHEEKCCFNERQSGGPITGHRPGRYLEDPSAEEASAELYLDSDAYLTWEIAPFHEQFADREQTGNAQVLLMADIAAHEYAASAAPWSALRRYHPSCLLCEERPCCD